MCLFNFSVGESGGLLYVIVENYQDNTFWSITQTKDAENEKVK